MKELHLLEHTIGRQPNDLVMAAKATGPFGLFDELNVGKLFAGCFCIICQNFVFMSLWLLSLGSIMEMRTWAPIVL